MQALFLASAESLRHYPLACREGRRHGTRELVVHPNYILVY